MIHFPTLNDPASKCNTHTIGSDLPSSIQHFIPHIIPSISIPRLSQSRDDKDLPPPNPPPPPRPSSQIAALPPPLSIPKSIIPSLAAIIVFPGESESLVRCPDSIVRLHSNSWDSLVPRSLLLLHLPLFEGN